MLLKLKIDFKILKIELKKDKFYSFAEHCSKVKVDFLSCELRIDTRGGQDWHLKAINGLKNVKKMELELYASFDDGGEMQPAPCWFALPFIEKIELRSLKCILRT